MRIDQTLKRLLAAELCAIMDGWDQAGAAAMLGLHQPQLSALRNGRTIGFSSDRLLRLILRRGYDVEILFREIPRRLATTAPQPVLTVQRFDRNGRLQERPKPGPVRRMRRFSGEVDLRAVRVPHDLHGPPLVTGSSDPDEEEWVILCGNLDTGSDMDDG